MSKNKRRKSNKKTRVYVCSSLRPHVVKRVNKILEKLLATRPDVEFFRPYGTDPNTMLEVVREDTKEIEGCDELWLIGRAGRDCCVELGMALALKKDITVYLDHTNRRKLAKDEMWKIGVDRGHLKVVELGDILD
jgi:hypothetical protein